MVTNTMVLPRMTDIFHVSDNRRPNKDMVTDLEKEVEFEIVAEYRTLKLCDNEIERSIRLEYIQTLNTKLARIRKAIRGWNS